MTFRYIPAGTFTMGSPDDEPGRADDETQKQATISQGFYMQTTEVTQGQWYRVMDENPSFFNECGYDCPVENISWDDVNEFIMKLNRFEKTKKYRLPTEAEWEYACRAGSTTALANGGLTSSQCEYDPIHDPIGWYKSNSINKTHPVAEKISNSWGLFDMHGNVWEWVQDKYSKSMPRSLKDPVAQFGWGRVFRGGSWSFAAQCSRSANRKWVLQGYKSKNIGFRVVMEE
ncbi:formylglycine-generating enzyme family protein [Thermodesulfobacteriota bacterium]